MTQETNIAEVNAWAEDIWPMLESVGAEIREKNRQEISKYLELAISALSELKQSSAETITVSRPEIADFIQAAGMLIVFLMPFNGDAPSVIRTTLQNFNWRKVGEEDEAILATRSRWTSDDRFLPYETFVALHSEDLLVQLGHEKGQPIEDTEFAIFAGSTVSDFARRVFRSDFVRQRFTSPKPWEHSRYEIRGRYPEKISGLLEVVGRDERRLNFEAVLLDTPPQSVPKFFPVFAKARRMTLLS